ncbi:hypothetical protein D3C80_1438800 [compost metagenome]
MSRLHRYPPPALLRLYPPTPTDLQEPRPVLAQSAAYCPANRTRSVLSRAQPGLGRDPSGHRAGLQSGSQQAQARGLRKPQPDASGANRQPRAASEVVRATPTRRGWLDRSFAAGAGHDLLLWQPLRVSRCPPVHALRRRRRPSAAQPDRAIRDRRARLRPPAPRASACRQPDAV